MKASLKFREDQKPLLRAKVPLNILGLPFQSGIVAGESKELTLNLATFFESGPSFKIAYRPNDTWNPCSLIVKTGTGPFGSPNSSSMLMSAEFNLLGKGGNPSFMLRFKPQFGDFSIKKSQSSSVLERNFKPLQNGAVSSDDDASIEVVDSPAVMAASPDGGRPAALPGGKRITILPPRTASAMAGAISGVEVAARTKLPLWSHAVMNFRWGLRVPADIRSSGGDELAAGINFRKIPFLVMNKIGIVHVDGVDSKPKEAIPTSSTKAGDADVAESYSTVKRQLEALQAENGLLKKAVDDLRREFATSRYREIDGNSFHGPNGNRSERRGNEKKSSSSMEGDTNEDPKKLLKGGTA